MFAVVEHSDPKQLVALQIAWRALLGQTRGAGFLQSLDALQTYWQHFGRERTLRVLACYEQRRLVGVLPLVAYPLPTILGDVRRVVQPFHESGLWCGPVGHQPTATLHAAARYLRDSSPEWDLLDLAGVNRPEVDAGRTQTAFATAGLPLRPLRQSPIAILKRPRGSGQYRKLLRRLESQLRCHAGETPELAKAELRRHRPPGAGRGDGEPESTLLEAALPLMSASAFAPEAPPDLDMKAFWRDLYQRACAAGAADLSVLMWRGRVVAAAFFTHFNGCLQLHACGGAPGLQGALQQLLYLVFHDGFARGDVRYELPGNCIRLAHASDPVWLHARHYRHVHRHAARVQLLTLQRWWRGYRQPNAAA